MSKIMDFIEQHKKWLTPTAIGVFIVFTALIIAWMGFGFSIFSLFQ